MCGAALCAAALAFQGLGVARADEAAPAAPAEAPPAAAAQATGTGTISGKVVDAKTGEPIIDAGVELVGSGKTTRTDIDGKYVLRVPAGSYELRIFAPSYAGSRIKNVNVQPNQIARADATLKTSGEPGVEVVEVVAKANKAAEATQMIQRQKSTVIEDNVSAQIIEKSPDSNAAEIVQRVPAVTVKDDKYIYVRGLGERYSSGLLNGSRLPSTDPDRRVIPLNLFPSDFIESLNIIKTYEADLPGDFSGGLVDIHLRDYPDKLSYSIGLTTGGNTNSTFQPFYQDPSGVWNYWGFTSVKGIPSIIPKSNINGAGPEQNQLYGRAFQNNWQVTQTTAPPNAGVEFSLGNKLGDFGFNLAGTYNQEYDSLWNQTAKQFKNGTDPQNPTLNLIDDYGVNSGFFKTTLAGVLTSAYDLAPNQRLAFRALYNQKSIDEATVAVGNSEPLNFERVNRQTLEQYTQDSLSFGQLEGQHHWSNVQVDWRSAFSQTTRDTPDTRILVYTGDPGQTLSFTSDANSGVRAYSNLSEILSDSALDFTFPFTTGLPWTDVWSGLEGKFKMGPAYSYRSRTYDQRIFHFRNGPELAGDLEEPPHVLLGYDNIGPGKFKVVEETLPRDSFSATQEIAGGYGLFDLPIVDKLLRFVAGVRVEESYIVAHFFNDFKNAPEKSIKNNLDPLPSVAVITTPRDDMKVQTSWSQTVSRPEFRELSPTQYPTLRGFRPVIGNPDLVEAHITSYDLRWDWFLTPSEILSASYFYKTIDKPIETVLLDEGSNVATSFRNEKDASLNGFEVEVREGLGQYSHLLDHVSVIGNASYVDSNVNLEQDQQFEVQSGKSRPLQGQAPWIMNAAVEYAHPVWGTSRLLYNAQGRKLTELGGFGLPDIYEESRQQLDFVWLNDVTILDIPVTVKLAAENLLDDRYLFTQSGQVQERYKVGAKFTFGVTYRY